MNNRLLKILILFFLILSSFNTNAQAAESGTVTITVTLAEVEIIPATLEFRPQVIRPWTRYIRCYIELPSLARVEDIVIDTVALTEVNEVALESPLKTIGRARIGDFDRDGIRDLQVRFDIRRIIPLLQLGENSLTVSGNLLDGRKFQARGRVSF